MSNLSNMNQRPKDYLWVINQVQFSIPATELGSVWNHGSRKSTILIIRLPDSNYIRIICEPMTNYNRAKV